MKPHQLPIDSIVIGDRFRKDYGDIDDLATSIKEVGLIQPVVINDRKELVAGGRRMAALRSLGWTEVPVVLAEGAGDETTLRMMELEENIRRKPMNWQEEVLSITEIHRLKCRTALLTEDGDPWGQRHTGRLLGVATGKVNYCLTIAKELKKPDSPVHKCDSLTDAIKALLRAKEEEANRRLVAMSRAATPAAIETGQLGLDLLNSLSPPPTPDQPDTYSTDQCKACSGTGLNSKGSICPICKGTGAGQDQGSYQIPLSQMLFHTDCLPWMQAHPASVDHIITDPPYAIDMENLTQNDGDQAYLGLETVVNEHQEAENFALLVNFIPLAFQTLKDKGFLIMWCDQMMWETLYNWGKAAGFSVQRWPLTWVKTHPCSNQAAGVNFTKTTEIAIVMRKINTALVRPQSASHYTCSNDSAKRFAHPFAKPPELWEWLYDAVATPGQIVLDPFMGRGSAVYAAAKRGLRPIGLEKKEDHFNHAYITMQEAFKQWMAPKTVQFI